MATPSAGLVMNPKLIQISGHADAPSFWTTYNAEMDDYVANKLTEWGLDELMPAFQAEKIDKEAFLLLDASTLSIIIPQVGPRLKVASYLKKLLEVPGPGPGPEPEPEPAAFTPSSSTSSLQCVTLGKEGIFNIREILNVTPDGRDLVSSLENGVISHTQRLSMVRILVSHLMQRFGENPTSSIKAELASSVVEQFPCLKDIEGTGYDTWFTASRSHRPATGFLEERLRNVRKRLHKGRRQSSTHHASLLLDSLPQTSVSLPVASITSERALELAEWLRNNIYPSSQVVEFMHDTAAHRAQWIRANGTKPIHDICREFPRLVDTPGMISQDFSILYPDSSNKLISNWNHFTEKIIAMGKKEKIGDLLINIDNLSEDRRGDIALLLLPRIIPTGSYKMGRKTLRPSQLECSKAFIDEQPYPKACAQVWEFLQSCVFEIPGPVRSSVQMMRAQFAAQCT